MTSGFSQAGRTALEVFRALGGYYGVGVIANLAVINLLDKMAHGLVESSHEAQAGGRHKPRYLAGAVERATWMQTLSREDENRANRIFKFLVDSEVLKIGMFLRCSYCEQRNWYQLTQINDVLQCARCLRNFPFPASDPSPRSIEWRYRAQGPFSVGNFAQGSYSVVLAIRTLGLTYGMSSTWCTGLEISDGKGQAEIDYLFLVRPKYSQNKTPQLFIGEAKTFSMFKNRDITRARRLRRIFPNAILVFSTLNDGFAAEEKKIICRFIHGEKSRSPNNRALVLTLTQHQLTHHEGLWTALESLGEPAKTVLKQASREEDLFHRMCNITQQLHLDLEPWPRHGKT